MAGYKLAMDIDRPSLAVTFARWKHVVMLLSTCIVVHPKMHATYLTGSQDSKTDIGPPLELGKDGTRFSCLYPERSVLLGG
jgi:hypothetical protein